jgi:hypothetical protein
MAVVQMKPFVIFTLEDDVEAAVMQWSVLFGGDTSAGITVGCMPQHQWELLLRTTPSLGIIYKRVQFQTSLAQHQIYRDLEIIHLR